MTQHVQSTMITQECIKEETENTQNDIGQSDNDNPDNEDKVEDDDNIPPIPFFPLPCASTRQGNDQSFHCADKCDNSNHSKSPFKIDCVVSQNDVSLPVSSSIIDTPSLTSTADCINMQSSHGTNNFAHPISGHAHSQLNLTHSLFDFIAVVWLALCDIATFLATEIHPKPPASSTELSRINMTLFGSFKLCNKCFKHVIGMSSLPTNAFL